MRNMYNNCENVGNLEWGSCPHFDDENDSGGGGINQDMDDQPPSTEDFHV